MRKILIGLLALILTVIMLPAASISALATSPLESISVEELAAREEAAEIIENEHKIYLGDYKDRSSFVKDGYNYEDEKGYEKGEQLAAIYIIDRLQSFGYYYDGEPPQQAINESEENSEEGSEEEVENENEEGEAEETRTPEIILQYFSEQFSESGGGFWTQPEVSTRWSQNVILRLTNPDTEDRVVIGANMDNDYSSGDGALQGGSGVAILLYLASALRGETLPYSVDIVFFGAGYYGGSPYFIGAEHYVEKNSFGNILLMLNVGRIGGETTYVYSDEVKTELADYAAKLGSFEHLPLANLPLFATNELGGPDNYPYDHYGMSGNHSKFMQRGITVLNYFCGDYNGIALTDREGKGGILKEDTLENMLTAYPNAYGKMAETARAVFGIVTDEGLSELVKESKSEKFDYSIFYQKWVAYLIFGALAVIGFVVANYTAKALVRKYPPVKPEQKKKISVFNEFE